METVNHIVLLMISILAIINLIIEIEDVKTYKYEMILRICFGTIALGSLTLIFYDNNIFHTILYVALLAILINRLLIRKRR